MESNEIRSWFDQAFLKMSQGDFARASACFQVIIDRSNDLSAVQSARRDQAWCAPIQAIIARLDATPHPIPLSDLVTELNPALKRAEPNFQRVLVERLGKMHTMLPTNDRDWVSRAQLQAALERSIARVAQERVPRTFAQVAGGLFSEYGEFEFSLTPALLTFMNAVLWRRPELIALEHGCIFHRSSLTDFASYFASLIRRQKTAQSLRKAIESTTWNEEVRGLLSVRALGEWIQAQTKLGFVEVGDGYWSIGQLVDLATLDISAGFADPYTAPTTRDLCKYYMFPGLEIPPRDEFLPRAAEQLARNPRLVSLDGNRWVLRSSFDGLVEEMYARLLCADRPITLQELQSDTLAAHPAAEPFFALVQQAFQQRLADDPEVLAVSASTWLHGRSLPLLVNFICEQLRARPRRFADLVREIILPLTHGEDSPPDFLTRVENELAVDDRFLNDEEGRWRALPPGNRLNNAAYAILFKRQCPLTRQELDHAIKEQHGRAWQLDLSSDARFRQWTDRRWTLAEWVMINDHAADYLANSRVIATKQDIIKRSGVLPELAIFEPERDQRFVCDPNGRWTCRSAGLPLTSQMVEQLVRTVNNGMTGITLDQLVKRTFQRPRSDFNGVEEALLRDGRVVVSDGIWYPCTVLHSVSAQEMETVRALLTQKEFPVSADEVASTVFGLPAGLTDLEDKMRGDPYIASAGTTGWCARNGNSPAFGQPRRILYPQHSSRYIPAVRAEHLVVADAVSTNNINPATGRPIAPLPRPQLVTITLGYEDIRDGSLATTAVLWRFFGTTLALRNLCIADRYGSPITCWYDSEHELIQGLGSWFRSQELYYGDKLRLWRGSERDEFFVEPAGERDETVHRESTRRHQLHDLLKASTDAKIDVQDVAIQILEFFGCPVHVDDLWRLVDSDPMTKKDALLEILSEYPFFSSVGTGYWRYDQKEYERMIRELEQKVRLLTEENRDLQLTADKITELHAQVAQLGNENEGLKSDLERATNVLKDVTDERTKLQISLGSLTSDLATRGKQLQELQDRLAGASSEKGEILEQYNETISQLQAQLEETTVEKASLQETVDKQQRDLASLDTLLRAKEQELATLKAAVEKQQASINELGRQLGGAANKLTYMQLQLQEEQENNQKLQKDIEGRSDTFQSALRAKEEAHATKAQAIKEIQEKVNEATVAIKNAEKAEAARVAVFEDLENGRREIERLKGQIEDLKAGRDALMAQYARAEADRQQFEKMLTEARRQRDTMIEQYDRLNVDYRALRAADLTNKQVLKSPLGKLARILANPDDKPNEARPVRRKKAEDDR